LTKFTNDENPAVKKDLSIILKELVSFISLDTYMDIINSFIIETNDIVRIPLMDNIIAMKSIIKNVEVLPNIINKLASDESWRVRLTVADKLHELLTITPLKGLIIDVYAKLFEDNEAEVRNICCMRLELICQKVGKDESIDKILVQLKKIEKDSVGYVRAALAGSLLKCAPLVGKQKTNDFIFSIFLNLIKDENHDIRMTLFKTIDSLNHVINVDMFIQSILVSILEIANNKIWRTRIQICDNIPVLAGIMVNII
jgi:serine/threonine-protein phosphatase 2A regulatory subunit A